MDSLSGRSGGSEVKLSEKVEKALRDLVDSVVAADLPDDGLNEVVREVERLTESFNHWIGVDGPVDPRLPAAPANARIGRIPWVITSQTPRELVGLARFRLVHAGSTGVVHGGAVAFLMDEAMGVFANSGVEGTARTAMISVNFRAVTPIETDLLLHVECESTVGRKQQVVATLSNRSGRELVAATGLFITVDGP